MTTKPGPPRAPTAAKRLPRGLRNNNPGNIRRIGKPPPWQGQSSDQSGDAEFLIFDAPLWGLRALGRVLRTYYRKYGDVTVRRMIARYAPQTENDTGAYVAAVSQFLGVDADATLRCDAETWVKLMRVIVRHENGLGDYYPVALYWDAANRALS